MFESKGKDFNPIKVFVLILDLPDELFENFSSNFSPTITLVIPCMTICILYTQMAAQSFPKCSRKLWTLVGNNNTRDPKEISMVEKSLTGNPFGCQPNTRFRKCNDPPTMSINNDNHAIKNFPLKLDRIHVKHINRHIIHGDGGNRSGFE